MKAMSAVFRGEMLALAGGAGIHQRRERLLDRLRHREALVHAQELALVIELLLARPEQLHDLDPLGRVFVARVVLHDAARRTSRAPARNQPQTMLRAKRPLLMWSTVVACFAAMIGWTVGTCEVVRTRDVLRRLREAGGPGIGLEIGAVEIGLAAEALPARHRHQRLEAEPVGACGDGSSVFGQSS